MTETVVHQPEHPEVDRAGVHRAPGDAQRVLNSLWRRRFLAPGLVTAAGALTGAVSALLLPRGPTSSVPGVAVMVTGLVLGALAGLLLRRRRAVLLALVAHVAVLELVRWPVDGPTVDGIHLTSLYGGVAFVTGRGFYGLLLIPAALVGAVYGAGLARRWSDPAPRRRAVGVRRVVSVGCALALLGGAVLVARPAHTDAIRGPDGGRLAGSVAELATMRVGGHDTTVMLRGRSAQAPVLLYLAGGPGGTDLGAMRLFGQRLERDFLVATWDQRGAGTSYAALDPTSTLTLDQVVRDTIELVQQLRSRFGERPVYLVANSWGTVLGVLAVQRRPDLFAAYVGAGQMVDPAATDRMFYEDTLAWARRGDHAGLVKTLQDNGPPPYTDILAYESALTSEHEWNAYPMVPAYAAKGEMPANVMVPEYDVVQKVRALSSFLDTFAALYPQLQHVDLRVQTARLKVPVYIVTGEHEARGRAVLAKQWYAALQAPRKQWVDVAGAGHRAMFEQPAVFASLMRTVLAETAVPR